MELMNDPVMVATGHTYDRVCIERWLQQGNRTCPVTGMRLRHLELTPNFALRNAIQVTQHFWCLRRLTVSETPCYRLSQFHYYPQVLWPLQQASFVADLPPAVCMCIVGQPA